MTEYENRADASEHDATSWAEDGNQTHALTAALLAISARIADLTDAVRSVQQ